METLVCTRDTSKETDVDALARFKDLYKRPAEFVVRAPGRANIIGEHIDYNGYSVLPFALQQGITIYCAASDDGAVHLANTNEAAFPHTEFSAVDPSFDYKTCHHWSNYVRAGFLAAQELYEKKTEKKRNEREWKGMYLLAAGLSSSSALVVSSGLASIRVNDLISLSTPEEFASACALAEMHVGTLGGGMDQAISVNGKEGCAELISFVPKLSLKDVHLPANSRFIIANSMFLSSKCVTADGCYNKRVVECRLAVGVMAKTLGIVDWSKVTTLRNFQERAGKTLEEMPGLVKSLLCPTPYTLDKIIEVLGIPESEVRSLYFVRPVTVTTFDLYSRAMHCYTESARVLRFVAACEGSSEGAAKIAELGRLMVQSHESCRDLYECSHPAVDRIVEIALKNGAAGARITGAGWGGSAIALADGDEAAERVIGALKREYYDNPPCGAETGVRMPLFATKPCKGASIENL